MDKKNYTLTDISVIKRVMGKHNVTFSKGLGQNFLVNPTVCPRMAEAVKDGTTGKIGVLEIGAGVGVLTKELLERADKVVCIELDTRLFPVLNDTLSGYDNLTLINEDILKGVLITFLQKGGHIFQGNTTSVEELKKAMVCPQDYQHLMVRVGGFSARFVNLSAKLQNEIISRYRHRG